LAKNVNIDKIQNGMNITNAFLNDIAVPLFCRTMKNV